jgi:hypothetical protein
VALASIILASASLLVASTIGITGTVLNNASLRLSAAAQAASNGVSNTVGRASTGVISTVRYAQRVTDAISQNAIATGQSVASATGNAVQGVRDAVASIEPVATLREISMHQGQEVPGSRSPEVVEYADRHPNGPEAGGSALLDSSRPSPGSLDWTRLALPAIIARRLRPPSNNVDDGSHSVNPVEDSHTHGRIEMGDLETAENEGFRD